MKELDMVMAKKRLSNNVQRGCIGTIVFVYEDPTVAYEVEFFDQDGNTVELRTVTEKDISEADEKMMLKIIFNEIYEVELLPRCDE